MRHSPGFTLLEVLVAGAIAAAMMAALFGVLRDSAVSMRAASGTGTALAVARNHLALLEPGVSDAAPRMRGQDGAYEWETTVTREAVASPGPGIVAAFLARNSARPVLLAVEVVVRWDSGGTMRHIRLSTHRLGHAPPDGGPQ